MYFARSACFISGGVGGVTDLVLDGREHAERWVPSLPVVEDLKTTSEARMARSRPNDGSQTGYNGLRGAVLTRRIVNCHGLSVRRSARIGSYPQVDLGRKGTLTSAFVCRAGEI